MRARPSGGSTDLNVDSAERALNDRKYSEARRDAKQAKMKALDALKASETSQDD